MTERKYALLAGSSLLVMAAIAFFLTVLFMDISLYKKTRVQHSIISKLQIHFSKQKSSVGLLFLLLILSPHGLFISF